MTSQHADLSRFLGDKAPVVLVEVREAKGSTPRERGAFMLVTRRAIFGTIGGGQLEFQAIDTARSLLDGGLTRDERSVALGPEIGQCCGGHVTLDFSILDTERRAEIERRAAVAAEAHPAVYVFGAGHVGRALANALAPLPLNVTVVETRKDMLDMVENDAVTTRLVAMPESVVAEAPPGAAFIVLTHDHALDFLICEAALGRADARYVGMIGSRTKRVTYERHHLAQGGTRDQLGRLVSPIGAGLDDKRPEVIAALVAAEVLKAVL